jgi:hypothetical protein
VSVSDDTAGLLRNLLVMKIRKGESLGSGL